MKKFKWFTLLESLTVIVIIWIISTALYNMRNIWKNSIDLDKEAVNVIYKEINQSLKDFQRNKIWIDSDGVKHEISTFQIMSDWKDLEIWNTYVYCQTNNSNTIDCYNDSHELNTGVSKWSGYYDSKALIKSNIYIASKHLKNIDTHKFYIWWIDKWTFNDVSFTKYWEIISWEYINSFIDLIHNLVSSSSNEIPNPINEGSRDVCQWIMNNCSNNIEAPQGFWSTVVEILKCWRWSSCNDAIYQQMNWNDIQAAMNVQYNTCINKATNNNFFNLCSKFIDDLYWEIADEGSNTTPEWNTKVSFIIFNSKEKDDCNRWYLTPIWQVEINTVTKKATLKRCPVTTNPEPCWSNKCE